MPNPLARITRRPSATPTDRPKPIIPRPESYVGANQPWRGTEEHGVKPTEEPRDPESAGFDATGVDERAVFVPIVPHEKDETPVPVRIVQETARELRTWRTDRRTAAFDRIEEVLGRDQDRTRVTIRNLSADKTLIVGDDRSTITVMGMYVYAGQDITLATEEPVYVTALGADATANCLFGVVTEFVRSEK